MFARVLGMAEHWYLGLGAPMQPGWAQLHTFWILLCAAGLALLCPWTTVGGERY